MKYMVFLAVSTAVLCAISPVASAHRPLPNDGTHNGPESALHVSDATISQVAYHEVTVNSPQLWLSFDGKAGQEIYLQLGVPVLDRLADYRPALALIGPGLPETVPFDIPAGLGARVLPTDDADPRFFDEHFTGTSSWILLSETVELPAAGRYYVVAYNPSGLPGKLWVSVGQRELFDLTDLLSFPAVLHDVREFHEVGDDPLPLLPLFMNTVAIILGLLMSLIGLP